MKYALMLSAIAPAAWASQAQAQDADDMKGFYLGANVGVARTGDVDVTFYDVGGTFGGTGTTDTADGEFDTRKAVKFGGVLGYDFGMIRADIEIDYSRQKVRAFTINSINGTAITLDDDDRDEVCEYLEADTCAGSGNSFAISGTRLRQLSGLANVWLDVPLEGPFVPYVGGGAGIAGFEVDGEGKGKFAWQIGAGAAFHVSDTVAITADFRHRESSSTDIAFDASSGFRLGKLKTDSLSAGLRFTF